MNIYEPHLHGAAMDLVGYHALSCTPGVRHNALRDVFLRFLSLAGIGLDLHLINCHPNPDGPILENLKDEAASRSFALPT